MSHKNLAKKYQKKTQLEHILDLPDTYIGSIEKSDIDLWVYDDNNMMQKKTVNICNGLYKIFDEILVNASDHHVRLKEKNSKNKVNIIKVNIDPENNCIIVYNNGEGIPVAIHPEHKIYVPEMLFGNLLTSENYNKDEKKIVGGKNGYGATLVNIYSTKFIVETVDSVTKKKYVQEFSNNMKDKSVPEITKSTEKSYTQITFYPDLERFNMEKLDDDIISLMKRRVYDLTATTDKTLTVYLNDEKIDCKLFEKYIDMYIGNKSDKSRIYELVNDRWELAISLSNDEEFEHVSFVNGINTYKGGKHVEYVSTHIANKLSKYMAKKGRNKVNVKPEHIKKNMFLFLKCSIENPSFDSQTKEYMTTISKNFGSTCKVSDKFIEKLSKTGIIERSVSLGQHKDDLGLAKKEIRRSKVRVAKLEDANFAGGPRSSECTLILTEGDSAKATAISGLAVVGRDKFGVFPLKGKLLNVREATTKQLIDNQEINNIKTILGLQQYEYVVATDGKKDSAKKTRKIYKDVKELRYGRVMLLVDQDKDGIHIKGLLMNFINTNWPELSEIADFIISLATPIIKVTKGKYIKSFYTMAEYNKWKDTNNIKGWIIKYYKGLATSTAKEAQEYFQDIENSLIKYQCTSEECHEAVKLGFSKDHADQRKDWLKNYDENSIIEQTQKNVSFNEFINKELIHFSEYDCIRSIPSLCDGLKPSQRKILYSCFKRNLLKEIKVSQFAGYISENSSYHHGENSLYEAIIKMAQDFIGSNNINLLSPNGQFGTRMLQGKDAGSPRYIFTKMTELTPIIYNKLDIPLYEQLDDDGTKIEPRWYLPILPMILVNGAIGIGTGYSTNIPCFNPLDIIKNVKNMMQGKELKEMVPWYRGFEGTIVKENDTTYLCHGVYKFINDTTLEITELPVGIWTTDYFDMLDDFIIDKSVSDDKKKKKQCIASWYKENDSTGTKVHVTIKIPKITLDNYKKDISIFEKKFDLVKSIRTSNMHLYNHESQITKYNNVEDILQEFYKIRLEYYLKRKLYWLVRKKKELDIIAAKIKFIEYVRDQKIDIRKEEEIVVKILEENDFPKFSNNDLKGNVDVDNVKNEDSEDIEEENHDKFSYDYLLRMQIRTLTQKIMEKMKKEYEEKMALYKELEGKSDKDLWNEDLNMFMKVYPKVLKEWSKLQIEISMEGSTTKKKVIMQKIKIV